MCVLGCGPQRTLPTSVSVPGRDDLIELGPNRAVSITDDVTVTVGDGVSGLLVQLSGAAGTAAYASFYLTHWWVPVSGQQQPDDLKENTSNGFMTRDAREVPGHVDWLYPNSDVETLVPGLYRMSVDGRVGALGTDRVTDGTFYARFFAHRSVDDAPCTLSVEFIFAKGLIGGTNPQMLADQLVAKMGALYKQVNISINRYWAREVPLDSADLVIDTRDPKISALAAASTALDGAKDNALHLILVNSVTQGGEPVAGYSLGLPGPYRLHTPDGQLVPNAGVLVALGEFGDPQSGGLDIAALGTTCAHEGGHYLGLYHTSELATPDSDPISDTPECRQGEGRGPCDEMSDVMYPSGGASRSILTHGQGRVMRRHPLCTVVGATPSDPDAGSTAAGPAAGRADCPQTCPAGQLCQTVTGVTACRAACDAKTPCAGSAVCTASDDGSAMVCAGGGAAPAPPASPAPAVGGGNPPPIAG
jgi:hypothetical protein